MDTTNKEVHSWKQFDKIIKQMSQFIKIIYDDHKKKK